MEAANLEQRLNALRQRATPEMLPLWSTGCDPSESLRLLSEVQEPWAALFRAAAYLRRDMVAEAQIELDTLSPELSPGIKRMKAVVEKKVALHLCAGGTAEASEGAQHNDAPLQQWLSRVREFRTRS